MRAFAFASAASLAVAALPAEAAPQRVASLNMCTDEILLMLAGSHQIASVTHLSHQRAEAPWWRSAGRYPRNDGSLLSVVPLKPDLVITMGGGAADRDGIARRLNIRLLDLPYPLSFADMRRNVARVAVATGQAERGRDVLKDLARAWASRPGRPADTIFLSGGGRTVSPEGLSADWMRVAGLKQRATAGDRVGLEQLAAAPPAILLRSDYRQNQYSDEQRWLAHPLANPVVKGRTVRTDGRYWTCLGPATLREAIRLRKAVTG
jgi:iron complex transport system substrate-binding protein